MKKSKTNVEMLMQSILQEAFECKKEVVEV